jgi:hypothetical protein
MHPTMSARFELVRLVASRLPVSDDDNHIPLALLGTFV